MANVEQRRQLQWWGTHDIARGQSCYWRIGPLQLWIHREEHELFIAYERGYDPLDHSLSVEVPTLSKEGPEATVNRYVLRPLEGSLELVPALANRPLVVNPAQPFFLPANHEATLFISSPLWFQVRAGNPSKRLQDEPTFRPSDTWFGSSKRVGELCYATKTSARMLLEQVPILAHRAVSAVRVRNRAASELQLNQIRLPMPNLSLFSSPDGRLWTEALIFDRDVAGGAAAVRLEKGPPAEAGETTLLTEPRYHNEGGFLFEAFGGLFPRKKENADE